MSTTQNPVRTYTQWRTQAKVKKIDEQGQPVEGHAFGGQMVAVSPTYRKGGVNFRVRPVNPVAFFAAFCYENKLIPEQLTEEECQQPMALEILEPLFEATKHVFPSLASPHAASDTETTPSLANGFSFNIPQKMVEIVGTIQSTPTSRAMNGMFGSGAPTNEANLDAIQKKIEQMRSRNGTAKKKS